MSCLETFVTLRIFSESMTPMEIAKVLSVEATESRRAGRQSREQKVPDLNYWSWSSRAAVSSTVEDKHWAALLDLIGTKKDRVDYLKDCGCQMDICCMFVYRDPGGPSLDAQLLKSVAELELEVWWDVYSAGTQVYN